MVPPQLSHDEVAAAAAAVLEGEPGVARAALFGSSARGDNIPTSDYDILVEVDGPLSRGGSVGLEGALVDAIGWRVDLVVVDEWRYGDEILRYEIERDGVVLYDRDAKR